MHTNSDFFCILSLELPYILTLASGFLAGISLKKGWMVGPVQQAVKGTGRDDWYLLYFPLLYNADPLAFFAVAKVIFLGHVYLCNSYYFFIPIYPIPHSFKRLVLGQ